MHYARLQKQRARVADNDRYDLFVPVRSPKNSNNNDDAANDDDDYYYE